MAKPKVLNLHHLPGKQIPDGAVYVGRPSRWGNPIRLRFGVTREGVIREYREWLSDNPGLISNARQELRGRDLVCFCAPLACHADVLLMVANEVHGRSCCTDSGHSPRLHLDMFPVKRRKLKRTP